jgi:RNA polymerase primary sigma factor
MAYQRDALTIWLEQVRRFRNLGSVEEKELLKQSEDGDTAAKKKLLNHYLKIVLPIAARYASQEHHILDLINEGNEELRYAITKFEIARKSRFSTYVIWKVRTRIKRIVGTEKNGYRKIHPLSLDAELSDDSELTGKEGLKSHYPSPDAQVITETTDKSLKERLKHFLQLLPEKEAGILSHRYGLNGYFPRTLEDTGILYNLTRQRVKQLEQRALQSLSTMPGIESLKDYL